MFKSVPSKHCTVWEHSLSGKVWTKCPTRPDTQGAPRGGCSLHPVLLWDRYLIMRKSHLNTRAKDSKCHTPSFTRVQFWHCASTPIHLKDYRIWPFQFVSKRWNLHSSPKDPGHTDVKYFILRYQHHYIRLVIRNIGFVFKKCSWDHCLCWYCL